MTGLGRLLVDDTGIIVDADVAICTTLRAQMDQLVGHSAFEITAPGDRDRCIQVFGEVLDSGVAHATIKRFIRLDGTQLWVQSCMARVADADGRTLIAGDIRETAPPTDWVDPAELLRLAHAIVRARRGREAVFSRALFADSAWDILLGAYIAEAEGRTLTTADLHAAIGISIVNASRWIRALNADGLIEHEGTSAALITSCIRLSCDAHQKFEYYLSDLYRSTDRAQVALASR